MSTIGKRVKQRRLELNLSQRELAVPGVSYAYISRIEAGTRNPSLKALIKIAPRLNTTALFLITGQSDHCPVCRTIHSAEMIEHPDEPEDREDYLPEG